LTGKRSLIDRLDRLGSHHKQHSSAA
jgi:hypothetical protein